MSDGLVVGALVAALIVQSALIVLLVVLFDRARARDVVERERLTQLVAAGGNPRDYAHLRKASGEARPESHEPPAEERTLIGMS